MATTSKQRLALAICDFLTASASDGTLAADDRESIDVAVNCIAESFKVDPTDKTAVSAAIGDQNLLKIYSVYEKLKGASKPAAGDSSSAAAAAGPVSEEKKKEAEGLKSKGNAAMAQKDYTTAVDYYSQALSLNPDNVIYLSNRAAAYSADKSHEKARADAEAAVAIDPKYTKAWSRLGLARFALGDPQGSMEAYEKGIEHEGNGGSEPMKKGYETAKRKVEELGLNIAGNAARGATPSLADLLGGAGGPGAGGGAGGMPDFGSIMNNPMFASMAQSLMSNPDMMSNLMSNPRLREMANQFSSGGGMPDMSALMSDPTIADMARSMMGGGGAGADGGAGAGRGAGQ
ncbi:hypothetical protein RB594_008534 [Gaeumannomyces avenae]